MLHVIIAEADELDTEMAIPSVLLIVFCDAENGSFQGSIVRHRPDAVSEYKQRSRAATGLAPLSPYFIEHASHVG